MLECAGEGTVPFSERDSFLGSASLRVLIGPQGPGTGADAEFGDPKGGGDDPRKLPVRGAIFVLRSEITNALIQ